MSIAFCLRTGGCFTDALPKNERTQSIPHTHALNFLSVPETLGSGRALPVDNPC